MIAYLPATTGTEPAWGFQCTWEVPRYRWFKTCLETPGENPTSEPYFFSRENDGPRNAPESARDLIFDYLRCLRLHIEDKIREDIPFNGDAVKYVIAVPPGWSDHSRLRAQECATRAGMTLGAPRFVNEPEAAAFFQFGTGQSKPAVGETYVLCDIGGRTADLISFVYCGPKHDPIFRPAAAGSNGNCGGIDIDVRFREFLQSNLSRCPGWSDRILHDAVELFEKRTKRNFKGDLKEEFKIQVEGIADDKRLNIKTGKLLLYGAELVPIFAPTVDQIVDLVNQQIRRTESKVRAVILVGGFAASPYVSESINLRTPRSIPVFIPPHVGQAVALGALQMGLDRLPPSTT